MSITSKCKISRAFKYSAAYDIDKDNKKGFIGFNSINELKNHIDQSTNNHFYEQITSSVRKLYLDIDFGKSDSKGKYSYKKVDEFDIFISDIIDKINNELNIINPIVIIQVAYKKIYDIKYISSCHLIYQSHMMSYLKQKSFIKHMNNKYDMKIDPLVYKSVQLFRLVGHCKMGKSNLLIPYNKNNDDNEYTFNDCFISEIKDCISTTHNFIIDTKTKTKKNKKVSSTGQAVQIENKNLLMYDNISDIFPKIMEDLDSKFWMSSDWSMITKILIKKKTVFNMFEWCRISAIKSDGAYKVEANNLFVSNWKAGGNVKDTLAGIPKMTEILSEYLPYKLKYNKSFDMDKLIDFIILKDSKSILNIDKMKLDFQDNYDAYFSSTSKSKKLIMQSDNIVYDVSSGFLSIINEETYNFYYDETVNNDHLYLTDLVYNNEFDKIDDPNIMKLFEEFQTNDKRVIVVSGSWGVGKSHNILKKHLKNISISDGGFGESVCAFVTPNNSFNLDITESLNKDTDQEWISHLDIANLTNKQRHEMENHDYAPNVISSLESIKQIEKMGRVDHLILDEFTSIFSHFESNTTNLKQGQKYSTYKSFCESLNNSSKIIILDANIIPDQIKTLQKILKITDNDIESIKINEYKFSDYKHIIYNNNIHFDNHILEDLKSNVKIAITTNSKNATFQYFEAFKQLEYNNKKDMMLINGECIKIIKINTDPKLSDNIILDIRNTKEKQQFLKNLESNLERYKVAIFIYSPTISLGVSVRYQYFDKMYGAFCTNSLNARGCIQQIYRLRDIKNKEIHILIKDGIKQPHQELDLKTYKSFTLKPHQEINRLLKVKTNHFNKDPIYTDVRSINKKEILISNENFGQIFIKYLRYYKAKISFNIIKPSVMCIDKGDINEILQDQEFDKYMNTELITPAEYFRLCKLKDNKSTDISDIQHNQVVKFNKLVRLILIDNTIYASDGDYINKKIHSYGLYPYHIAKEYNNNIFRDRDWFNKYYYKPLSEYVAITQYLKYDKNNDERYIEQLIDNKQYDSNDKHNNNLIIMIQNRALDNIIRIFGIIPDHKIYITNKQFNDKVSTNPKFFRVDLIHYYQIIKMNSMDSIPMTDDKKYYKIIFNAVRGLLKKININLSYISKSRNTSKPGDKMCIEQFKEYNFKFYNHTRNHMTYYKKIDEEQDEEIYNKNDTYNIITYEYKKCKFNQHNYNFYNDIKNKDVYQRFKKIDNKIIFTQERKGKSNIEITNTKMYFKTYTEDDPNITKIRRSIVNEHKNILYKHVQMNNKIVYKEYQIIMNKSIEKLSNRISPAYTAYEAYENISNELNEIYTNKHSLNCTYELKSLESYNNRLNCLYNEPFYMNL